MARKARLPKYILSVWGSDVYDFPYESRVKNHILKRNVRSASYLASTSNCMAVQLKKVMQDEKLEITITPFGVDLNKFDPKKYKEIEKEVLDRLKQSEIIDSDTMIIVEASLNTSFSYLRDMGYELFKEKKYKTNKHMFIYKN